jgi:hypothetical protein
MSILNLTSTQLRQAADLKEKIAGLEHQLAQLTQDGQGSAPVKEPTPAKVPGKRGPKKGGMSAAGRARIAAAQKARWAKVNAAKAAAQPASMAKSAGKKRKMSAAGRAAISAAAKARWAAVRAAKKA